jgi:predicted MPP superfamily phosphohydrolase
MFWILPGLLLILVYLLYRAYKNTQDVILRRESVGEWKRSGGRSLQVLHLSDLHLENISISPIQLYEQLKDEKIDLIALTGDFLDRKRSIPKLIPYLQVLNQLRPTHGMYAVFGNHDYVLQMEDFEHVRSILHDHGCHTLQNEHVDLVIGGVPVNVIGIDDYSTKRSDLKASYTGINEGYNLVLTHDPNVVLEMSAYPFDYLLSGHFHGGQICWPKPYHLVKMGKLVQLNMIKGMHSYNGKPFYISEGLGQTGFNIRVGSRPEITLHRIALPEAGSTKKTTSVAV